MILKNKLLVFLDKKYPPEHSFIDGMLLDLISNSSDSLSELCADLLEKVTVAIPFLIFAIVE